MPAGPQPRPKQPQPPPQRPYAGLPIDRDAITTVEDNPDFDDLILDDALYQELGITREELEEQRTATDADLVDPQGFNLGLEDASSLSDDVPMDIRLRLLDKDVFGPEVRMGRGAMGAWGACMHV